MSLAVTADHQRLSAEQTATVGEQLRLALLWLTALSGAFVFVEPSPYEIVSLATILLFLFAGLTLSSVIMPMILLLAVYNVGFSLSVLPVASQPKVVQWVLISWYLGATCIFFAAALSRNTMQRVSILVRGYTLGAVIASLAGIGAYFGLIPGASELFLRFGRAQGTFNDPNVLGAFLVFPALIAFQRILVGRLRDILAGSLQLAIFSLAILLSFSRAAWGQLVFCMALMMLLTLLTTFSGRVRIRIVILTIVGVTVFAALIAVVLSFDQVGDLFKQRASLDQSYDSGPMGRFGRHIVGFQMALDRPFGLGPMQFNKIFVEDPHNAYLNAFMAGGWLAGFSYITLTILTLFAGARYLLVQTPRQRIYIAIFAAYVGLALESAIIDSDHWRHYFLIVGVLWGLIAATRRYLNHSRRRRAEMPPLATMARTA
jgi:O-antigen ligase